MIYTHLVIRLTILLCIGSCTHRINSISPTANKIDEELFLNLGHIEQWVTIKGENNTSPVLLLLHGGPGDVQSCFTTEYKAFEKDFILVQWDQRGSGKTYGKYKDTTPSLTLNQVVQDGIELAKYLNKRFNRKIIIVGHSWGSVIATKMATNYPNLFSAYVGTGQVASWSESVQWQFNCLKKQAKKVNDNELLNILTSIQSPDPDDTEQYFSYSWALRKFLISSDSLWLANLTKKVESFPKNDFDNIVNGMSLSGKAMLPFQVKANLSSTEMNFQIPYIVIQGKEDVFTPTEPVQKYFEKINAPRKKIILLNGAGHFALTTHIQDFINAIKSINSGKE
jgi:pimeloyl-ACP methyl ester carboxylesterase